MSSQDDDVADKPDRPSFSRRDFLKTAGISSLAATVAAAADAEAQTAVARSVGPGDVPVQLMVSRRLDRIEPRHTPQRAQDAGNLARAKRVTDRACGACTVIIDGRSAYSCSTLAIEVQGKQIRTIDGLASGTTLHPVQQAFCDVDALMCGFCTPGFVMAAVALLEKNPNPTVEQAKKGLDGNICRCGTFTRILEATMKAKGVARA